MTAVEFLLQTFKLTNVDLSHHKLIIEQVKEMEKQQIVDAYSEGDVNGIMDGEVKAEQYYNQKFNK